MNKKVVLAGSALILVLSGSAMAFGKKGHDRSPADFLDRMLDLSDDQIQQIEQIHEANKAQFKAKYGSDIGMTSKRHGKKKMMGEFLELDPDSPDYQSQLQNLAEKRAEMVKARILMKGKTRQQIHSLLTDDQKQTLKEKKEKFKEKMLRRAERHQSKMQGGAENS